MASHPVGFAGVALRAAAHVVAPHPTVRMARTAPALRLPPPEPALWEAAGASAATARPALARVLLARAALQSALAETA
ncbi:hypothetical protein AMOR_39970 [Anaeromyxobacter oryzae]|uniref:Uncharacterized protein n=2 Tax=Anaeromyxobacter oryzae TaxID=2918170 RepID=A0ABM7WZN5_9BACT|nr:hypothetical protein AMOR_39970 [Anaeromyxobacter oryzae]